MDMILERFLTDPTLWVLVSFVIFMVLAFVLGRRSVTGMMDAKSSAFARPSRMPKNSKTTPKS